MSSPTPRTHYRITYVVLCIGVSSFALLQSLVNPVLPTIQDRLRTDQSTVSWVLTAYLLSASVCTPIIGRIGDKVGKQRMLVVALSALATGSLLAALAPSIGVLIVARAIQGIGGGVLPLTFGIIRDEFPRERAAAAVGTTGALVAAGGGVGLMLAGPVVSALGYRWLFWTPMIITVVAAVAAAIVVPSSPDRTPGKINLGTTLLLSAWLVALLLGVSQGSVWGWSSGRILGLLAAAAVLLVVWIVCESRSEQPLVNMAMMRIPTVWTVNLTALLFGIGMYSVFALLPQLLQTPQNTGYGLGLSVTGAGVLLLGQTAGSFIGGILAGRLTARVGSKPQLVAGAGLSALGMLCLTVSHTEPWSVMVGSTLVGLAIGLAFAAMSNLVVQAVPPTQTGVASGMNANIRTIGGALGTALVTTVVTNNMRSDGYPDASGYTHGFLLLAITSALATGVALRVPGTRTNRHSNAPHPPLLRPSQARRAHSDPARETH
ncbi:MFS transporter [Streptomyces sp. NPDC057690]|uniref:MFS transporter n=1 Tax=Streptomyces sp. NPDC057690 TaxID=3346214 RepID=UPI0036CB6623